MPGDDRRGSAGVTGRARRRRAAARAFACVLLLAGSSPVAAREATFDYLHVEANEGSASGGHVAIRFDDETYHFQHHPGGMLRLHRDHSAAFLHAYGRLENRQVNVRRVAVDAATRELLRRRFADRFVLEDAQHARLAALRADRALLDDLVAGRTPAVTARGLRFFTLAPDAPEPGPRAPAIDAVRATIEEHHPALLDTRRDETWVALRDLIARHAAGDTGAGGNPPIAVEPHRLQLPEATLVEELAELLEASAALDVLATGAALRRDAVRDDAVDLLLLGDAERAALTGLRAQLAERAVSLAASRRPDWGRTLLLALARLATVEESLGRGRLVVLDAYPRDAAVLAPADVRSESHVLPELLRESAADLAAARRPLAATVAPGTTTSAPREIDITTVEAAVNRHLELSHAASSGAPLRLVRGTLLPSGEAQLPVPAVLANADPAELRAARDAVARRSEAYEAALRARYGYDLLARNCVSELLREIADALASDDVGTSGRGAIDCAGSEAALGGCIDPASRLRFIPFVSADAVDEEYRTVEREDLPSFRTSALEEMRARDGSVAVLLRESNVLGSTLYRPRDEDSVFLFFTDDLPAVRPLLGAANLLTGIGATAAGLFALPLDDGTLLVRGLRGTLFSVPELGFVSIRKGTFAWAPRAHDAQP